MTSQSGHTDAGEPALLPHPSPPPSSPPPLERIVEALLFAGGPPLTPEHACEIVDGLTPDRFRDLTNDLNREYDRQARPYAIRTQGDGYVLALRPEFAPLHDRLYGTLRQTRLSPAAIDVLALVAYRQPVTKQEVDGLRGVPSGAILRQLVRRGLVAIVQRGDGQHPDVAYGTTPRFLKLFRLSSLDDLPQTQDLQML
jgi:segregation and condensation protein B